MEKANFTKKEMITIRNENKKSTWGSVLTCPFCGCNFIKRAHSPVFCSYFKTRGNMNCNDAYWRYLKMTNKIQKQPKIKQTPIKKSIFRKIDI